APKGSTKWKFVKHENPFHLNERLTTQQGIFLCPADLSCSFVDNLKAMQEWGSDQNVVKLRLDLTLAEARNFAQNLKKMNLSCAALFPGLDGFARSIGQQIVHYEELAARAQSHPRCAPQRRGALFGHGLAPTARSSCLRTARQIAPRERSLATSSPLPVACHVR